MFGSWFKKKKEEPTEDEKKVDLINLDNEMDLDHQIEWLEENEWLQTDFIKGRRNILIMDDRDEIISSVIDDLRSLNATKDFSLDDYNIIAVSSKMAGFNVYEILEKAPDIEINYALLDIVLGGKKSVDGRRTMVDGVDVAIQIWEHFPSANILFFSGCIIEPSEDKSHFKSRFDSYTGEDLNDYIMPKDITIDAELDQLSEFFNGF